MSEDKKCPKCESYMSLFEKAITWFKLNELGWVNRMYYSEYYESVRSFVSNFDDYLTGERKWICDNCGYECDYEKEGAIPS